MTFYDFNKVQGSKVKIAIAIKTAFAAAIVAD